MRVRIQCPCEIFGEPHPVGTLLELPDREALFCIRRGWAVVDLRRTHTAVGLPDSTTPPLVYRGGP